MLPIKRWYRPGEIAEEFHVCAGTVRRWMKNGQLPFIKIGLGVHRRIPYESYIKFTIRKK